MNITCVVPTLGGGGAERVMTYLAAGLAARGHRVTLLTLYTHTPDFYVLDRSVERVRLDLPVFAGQGFWGSFKRLRLLKTALEQTRPDVVIDFMTYSVAVACAWAKIPFIYSDHLSIQTVPAWWWNPVRDWAFKRARAVTVLSHADLAYIHARHPRWNARLIYNPALPPAEEKKPRPAFLTAPRNVISVGRLTEQKGFDRLLRIWKQVCSRLEGWQLSIIGAGPAEAALRKLAEELKIAHSVQFIAPQKELAAVYGHADIYAMASRREGFPMVLLEAMAAGLPAVSYDCTGPDVIIRDDVDGFLVAQGDEAAFVSHLALLMADRVKREEFSARAPEVTQRFSLDAYLNAYEDLCTQPLK